ncbi:TniQ family protein [Sulfuricurvum sp.]|uniref:TniQ family protein n=1 Tax=Sulfuricurvum sp. TaxID=2025608 RepID=UPI0026158B2B|nr:TniQ family protein [Sulfuricurvum sp.]MDD2781968.1 TniQ family protein [Sulfuricurvum sp.]
MIKKVKNPAVTASRFLLIPKPLPDEILSSWLARTAYAHLTHPKTFMNMHFSTGKFNWRPNFDASVSDDVLRIIERKSTLSFETIYQMSLKSYESYLQESIIPDGLNTFIVPQRFCPVCLREDQFPYYRKSWKVLFTTVCFRHHCYLYDHCPSCGALLKLANMYRNTLPFVFCHKCGFDLRKARKLTVPKTLDLAFKRMQRIRSILKRGYLVLNKIPIYSFLFFEVFVQLAKLMLAYKKNDSIDHQPKIKNFAKRTRFTKTQPVIRELSIPQQFIVLSAIMELFRHYPKKFDRFLKANALTHWLLTRDLKEIAFWYENLLNKVAPQTCFTSDLLTLQEIQNAAKWLTTQGLILNKIILKKLFQCDFYHNKLGANIGLKKKII